jgi:hypothetical protein
MFKTRVTVEHYKLSDDEAMGFSYMIAAQSNLGTFQTSVCNTEFSRTRLNVLVSTVVTAAWDLATRSLKILGGEGGLYKRDPSGVLLELGPVTEEAL